MKLRILPAAIVLMLSVMAFKGAGIVSASPQSLEKLEPASGGAAKEKPKKEEKKDEAKKEGGHGEAKEGEEGKEGEHGEGEEKEEKPTIVIYQNRPEEQQGLKFTDAEKDVLSKLGDRRKELDKYADELNMKADMVEASSKKLDEKLAKLEALKTDTEKLLVTYNEHEDKKIKSLVKIYESMKPKQAAAVFDKMSMDIMLEIIDKMAEKKAALVLAQMSPDKAKEVTEELAKQRSLAQASGVKQGAADKIATK